MSRGAPAASFHLGRRRQCSPPVQAQSAASPQTAGGSRASGNPADGFAGGALAMPAATPKNPPPPGGGGAEGDGGGGWRSALRGASPRDHIATMSHRIAVPSPLTDPSKRIADLPLRHASRATSPWRGRIMGDVRFPPNYPPCSRKHSPQGCRPSGARRASIVKGFRSCAPSSYRCCWPPQPPRSRRRRHLSVEEKSIDQLQAMMAGGTSSEAITQAYLARIAAMDRTGPTLRAVIAVNPDADHAGPRELMRGAKAGKPLGALDGVPVLIKDNIETKDPIRDDRGEPCAEGQYHAARCAVGRQSAAARRGDPRQDQPQRMGQYPIEHFDQRVECGWRAGA